MKKLIVGLIVSAFAACASFAAPNFVQDSGTITWTNTGSANLVSGGLADLGDRYGVALESITATTGVGVLKTDGQWKFSRGVTNPITSGQKLYYLTATSVTTTATADTYVGTASETLPALTAVTVTSTYNTVAIDLNAWQRQVIVGVDVQAYDADLTTLGAISGVTSNISGAITSLTLQVSGGLITNLIKNN